MNFTALDIIHFWADSRKNRIQNIFPTNGKVCVYCKDDLSKEAVKICSFLHLIVKQPWTFQMKKKKMRLSFCSFLKRLLWIIFLKTDKARESVWVQLTVSRATPFKWSFS